MRRSELLSLWSRQLMAHEVAQAAGNLGEGQGRRMGTVAEVS